MLAVPAVALASHQFPDVPTGHPFHSEIGAIAKAGITAGYPDGGYHPNSPVTRQSMAAFMHRGFGRSALAVGTAPTTAELWVDADSTFAAAVPVRQLTITVPGATNDFGPRQLVHLRGRVHLNASMSTSAQGCPCTFYASIRDTTTTESSYWQNQTFESTTAVGSAFYAFDTEALFTAPPGPVTYQLEVGLVSRVATTNLTVFYFTYSTSLSADTFPFGPTGGSTVSAPGAQNVPANN